MVKIIGVSGISGAGKTTLVKQLAKTLNATALFWDDFDDISQGPEDYVEWYKSSGNCDDWKYDALVKVLRKLKKSEEFTCPATERLLKATPYILFDAPMGYSHKATGQFIDFLVCIDAPLDIALTRRLLRDYKNHSQPVKILEELEHYLFHARPLFILTQKEREISDLVIDGELSLEAQESIVLHALGILNKLFTHNGMSIR